MSVVRYRRYGGQGRSLLPQLSTRAASADERKRSSESLAQLTVDLSITWAYFSEAGIAA